jgi:Arc/MetJ family transcription regulator
MRTTLIIDEALVVEAMNASGHSSKSAVVRAGLECLIAHAAATRLAALGGSMPSATAGPRRRSAVATSADGEDRYAFAADERPVRMSAVREPAPRGKGKGRRK